MSKTLSKDTQIAILLQHAARNSDGQMKKDFEEAAHRFKIYAAAVQGLSSDLADITDAIGMDKDQCLEPPAVIHAAREMAAKIGRLEACLRAIADTKTTPATNHTELCALLVAMAKTEISR